MVVGFGVDKSGCDGGVLLVKDVKYDFVKMWLFIVEFLDEVDIY